MAEIIKMPKLGFDMQEGTFAAWVKKVGDQITSGEVIAEIETDKATVEVETYATGTLLQVLAQPGDILEVGAPIAVVGVAGEDISGLAGGGESAAPAPVEAVAQEEAPAATQAPVSIQAEAEEVESTGNGRLPNGVKASPIARRLAEERGLDLRQVRGSGPGGRVVREDIENFKVDLPVVVEKSPVGSPAPAAGLAAAPSYKIMTDLRHELVDVSRLRATIARRMVESKQFVPHFMVTTAMDTAELLALRKQINANLDEAHQVTVNDLIVKAVALSLRAFPNLNTHYHGDTFVRYEDINIGIAVALPQGGLINVVARNADTMSLSALAAKNKLMIAGARDGKVKPDDIEGSTFTVSNLGAFGVEHFTAIINPPEAGILAVGASQRVPVVNKAGEIVIGNVMKVTLSVDHRTSDGAEGAQFLAHFKSLIEAPLGLLV